jgi:iron complex outermembrane receptor protein
VNTITSTMIEDTQSSSVSDLLKYLPSTQMEARGSMDVGRPQSRGMEGSVVSNTHLNGFNFVSTTAYPMEMFDHVNVINSLTGALYGPANPAGNFDFYTKRPTDTPLLRASVGYGNGNLARESADISVRAGKNGIVGYRFNVLHEEGEGYVKGSETRRDMASAAFDIHVSPDTVVQLDGSYYKFTTTGYPGTFAIGATTSKTTVLPDAPDPTKQGYGVSGAGLRLKTETGSVLVKHDFNADWHLTTGVLRQIVQRGQSVPSDTLSLNSAGNVVYKQTVSTSYAGEFIVDSDQLTLNGKAKTGSIDHDLVIATNGYSWNTYTGSGSSIAYTYCTVCSFDDPTATAGHEYQVDGSHYRSGNTTQQAFVLGDTLTFNEHWSAMGVASYSFLSTHNYSTTTTTSKSYTNGLSPTVSLMYKPRSDMMTYIGYADSLQQGDTVTDTTAKNYGQTLDPYRSKQLEAGYKWRVAGINASAAVFRLQRPLAYIGADGYDRTQGDQVNHGLEIMANGNVLRNLGLFGGVTFLDPRLHGASSADADGKEVVGVPRFQANLLAEYSIDYVPGLVLSGNVHHTGRRAASSDNSLSAASYTTEDIGARYTTSISGKNTVFRFNVTNLSNEHYWVSIFPGSIVGASGTTGSAFVGAPRQFNMSVSVDL